MVGSAAVIFQGVGLPWRVLLPTCVERKERSPQLFATWMLPAPESRHETSGGGHGRAPCVWCGKLALDTTRVRDGAVLEAPTNRMHLEFIGLRGRALMLAEGGEMKFLALQPKFLLLRCFSFEAGLGVDGLMG